MLSKSKIQIKRVAFMGDAEAKRYSSHYKAAYKIAYLLAKSGYIIVNGGGPGVMLASTLGAKKAGGRVELVVIYSKDKPKNFEGTHKKNIELADKTYYKDDYAKRMEKLVEIADAFVFFKGGTGTISEIGLTWELAKFGYGGCYEPLIFYGKFWKKILNDMKRSLPLTKDETTVYGIANSPKAVLEMLEKVGN